MRNVINLISAFAVVGVIVGIIMIVFSEYGSAVNEAGMGTVVVCGIVAVIFQIIIWIMRKRGQK